MRASGSASSRVPKQRCWVSMMLRFAPSTPLGCGRIARRSRTRKGTGRRSWINPPRSGGRLLLGTVTREVLDAAPCAVAVAPAGLSAKRTLHFSTVGVGFDDAPTAHHALGVARSLAHSAHAELRLIWAAHLVARTVAIDAVQPGYLREVRAGLEDRLERAAAPIREEGVAVQTVIAGGLTIDALVEQSEHLDLLVLGSRGYGPLKRVLLGSISTSVINAARCPVLVVPRVTNAVGDEEHLPKRPRATPASTTAGLPPGL